MPTRFVPWGNSSMQIFSNLYAHRKSNVEKNVRVINLIHTNSELLSVA